MVELKAPVPARHGEKNRGSVLTLVRQTRDLLPAIVWIRDRDSGMLDLKWGEGERRREDVNILTPTHTLCQHSCAVCSHHIHPSIHPSIHRCSSSPESSLEAEGKALGFLFGILLISPPVFQVEMKKDRGHKRVYDLFTQAPKEGVDGRQSSAEKQINFRFFRNPVELFPASNDSQRVGSVRFEKTELRGTPKKVVLLIWIYYSWPC